MKAWRIDQHGGPEVLKQIEISKPVARPMQAIVRVEAVGLNHLDVWLRKGVEGHKFPLPMTPGGDITGVVEAVGPESDIQIGMPVILNPGISCGHCEACLSGFDPLCRSYGILGETQDGGCAEYIQVPVQNLVPRPKNLSATDAAALSIPFLTAWTMLKRKAQLQPGETILIHAGGSGVSTAAIQMAKLFGATVITTVGSDAKVEKAKKLGADFVIQYKKTPFREEVKKILTSLGKKGCEVVMDHIGADTFSDSLKCLSWGGRLVTCGATSGGHVNIDLKAIFFKNISILGTTMGSKGDFIKIVDLVGQGKLHSVVDHVYSFEELPKAFERLENREAFGKVVVQII